MSEHTPGPWMVDPAELDRPAVFATKDEHGIVIAEMWAGLPEEQVANARLIAAAPDLLDAARKAHDIVQKIHPDAAEILWQAIREATT